jgi:hypothetical protein
MASRAAELVAGIIDRIEDRPYGTGRPPQPTVEVVETLRFFVREGVQWRQLRAAAGRACGSTLRRRLDEWRGGTRTSRGSEHGDPCHPGARFGRGAIAQGRVQALPVVEDLDVLEHRRPGLRAGAEAGVVHMLLLERGEEVFVQKHASRLTESWTLVVAVGFRIK